MSNYKKILKFGATPLLLSVFLVACSDNKDESINKVNNNDVIATIDGASIKGEVLIDKLIERYSNSTVQELLLEEIIKIEAKKLKIKITDEEIKTRYDKTADSFGGEESLKSEIESNNMTIEDLNKNIKNRLTLEAVLKTYMNYTENDLKNYFDQHPSLAGEDDTAIAYHILVDDEKSAKDLIVKLDNSKNKLETFKELATKHSKDAVSASEGGFLDQFERSVMAEEFSNATFNLEPNSYSKEPVKTIFGYHLIYLVEKNFNGKKTFEEAKYDVDYAYFSEQYPTFIENWKNEKLAEYKAVDLLNDIDFSKQTEGEPSENE